MVGFASRANSFSSLFPRKLPSLTRGKECSGGEREAVGSGSACASQGLLQGSMLRLRGQDEWRDQTTRGRASSHWSLISRELWEGKAALSELSNFHSLRYEPFMANVKDEIKQLQ